MRRQLTIHQARTGHINLNNSASESWGLSSYKITGKNYQKPEKNRRIPVLRKVSGMTTGSHACLAVCLGLGKDASENCTAWRQFFLVQVLAFMSAKEIIKQPQGCFRMRLCNIHIKCQLNFVKPYTTMNLPKTWWKTIQGSRLSSWQRRTCFPKNQARKGPSSNRANLHWQVPGTLQTKNRNPPTNPGTDEMAGVCWGGWPPMAGKGQS